MALYKVTIRLAFIVFYAPYPSSVPVAVSHFADTPHFPVLSASSQVVVFPVLLWSLSVLLDEDTSVSVPSSYHQTRSTITVKTSYSNLKIYPITTKPPMMHPIIIFIVHTPTVPANLYSNHLELYYCKPPFHHYILTLIPVLIIKIIIVFLIFS